MTKALLIPSLNLFRWADYPMFFNRTENSIYVCQHQGLMIGVGVREPLHQRLTSIGPQQGRKQKQKTEKHLFFLWQLFPLKDPKAFRVSRWQSGPFTLLLLNMYLDKNQECNIYVQLYILIIPAPEIFGLLVFHQGLVKELQKLSILPRALPTSSYPCISLSLQTLQKKTTKSDPTGDACSQSESLGTTGRWWVVGPPSLQHQVQLDPPPILPPSPPSPPSSPPHLSIKHHRNILLLPPFFSSLATSFLL